MDEVQNGQKTVIKSEKPARKGINLWKFISVLLIVLLIGGLAYEFGKGQISFPNSSVPTPSPTNTITKATTSATLTASPTGALTPTLTSGKTVSAGIKNDLFNPYSLIVPSSFAVNHTANTASDTLTITKGQYVLTISQAAGGAGSCDYPGDTPEPMAQVFSNFVGITGTFSQFRRGTSDNKTYSVCEQKSGGFSFPTSVGYITYSVPIQADQATLAEMDGMIASIKK
jgi:hypothetical protein